MRGILITAAEAGYITELRCAMPACHCPAELGGEAYFVSVPQALPEWMPTVDHIQPKSQKGILTFGNVRLAHRLCNRMHYATTENRSIEKDLEKVEAARREAIERSKDQVVLRTERLELRPSAPEHVDEIWEAVQSSQAELEVWMSWAIEPSRESTLDFLRRSADEWSSGREKNFTIFMDGSACGGCSLMRIDRLSMTAEIGYWMRSDLCRRNLMTEAAAAVVDFGFYQEGLHRIELRAGVENRASIRVAEKLGFRKEGTHRHDARGASGFYDSHSFARLITDPRPDLHRL